MKKFNISFLLTVLVCLSAFSQKAPMKFGKVPMADLKMTVYDKDTSAPAVVLCDYGYFSVNQFQFKRMIRIKILKKEGLDYGNYVFQGAEKAEVRGITFNLVNGDVTKAKLKNDQIYRERVSEDYFRLRCAMPDVKVGSVLDIEYFYTGFPLEWDFQTYIPVKWSELIIEPSPYISFRKNFYGYESLAISTNTRWVAKDMPAFKKEAYVSTCDNYLTKFEFDLMSINFPGSVYYNGFYKDFTTTWNATADYLENDDYFGEAARSDLFLNSIARNIREKYTNPMDKAIAAYNVIKKIKWNKKESAFSSTPSLGYVYNKKIGNSADINLMLTSLFKKVGLQANFVVLSTRSNGIMPFYPSLTRLNYVISQVKIGNKTYLVDATEDLLPFGLLPFRCLNGTGREIDGDKNLPVDIKAPAKDEKTDLYTINIKDNDTLEGNCQVVQKGYAAFNFRKDYEKTNSKDEFIEDMEKKNTGLHISNLTIKNLDSITKPIQEDYNFTITSNVNVIDSMMYITPLLTQQRTENPFKPDVRKYPVDYGYTRERTYIFNYTIPDNYTVQELPKSVNMAIPNKGASFLYSVNHLGNRIVISCRFDINKALFLPKEYFYLKELYAQIIKKEAEPIVLKKI